MDAEAVAPVVRAQRRQVAHDVDAVRDRPGDPGAVVAPLHLLTGAGVRRGLRAVVAAGARVAGEHEHAARGQPHRLVAAGDGDLAALQGLAQRLDHVGPEQRELVEEEHSPMGPAELAGTHLAAAAAEQARLARVVVRGGERRPHQHPVAGLERPGERVDRGELERLLAGEVGQDARDPLGDAGLARALRPGQHQVVPAGGGHLDGVPRVGHADQVGQVDLLQPLRPAPGQEPAPRHRRDRSRLGHLLAAELGHHLGQRPHAEHGHAGRHRRLERLRLGHEDAPDAALRRGEHHRQHPRHRAQAAVERELPDERGGLEREPWQLPRGGDHRDGDRQVEVRAPLQQVRRGQQDRDPPGGRPLEVAVHDGHPAAVPGLVQGGVGAADQRGARPGRATRRPARRSGGPAPRAARPCGRSRTASADPPDVLDHRRPPARPQHGHQVDAHVGDPRPRGRPSSARPAACSRASLASSTASWGVPHATLLRVLTSHTTSTGPSRSTRSISPASHRQLRSSRTIPCTSTRCRAARDSPYAPSARRAAAVAEPVIA